ncbi:MAG: hypothetical protein ACKO2G_15870 [Verrucomicrobiales bacterium]
MNSDADNSPSTGADASGPSLESAGIRRAWELLGRATPTPVPHGFAARMGALAARTPQDGRPSRWLAAARLGLPLAAAAALLLSVGSNLLLPDPVDPVAVAAVQTTESNDLASLARIEAALLLMPDDAEDPNLDAAAIELASVDDPTTLTDEQLFGLLY